MRQRLENAVNNENIDIVEGKSKEESKFHLLKCSGHRMRRSLLLLLLFGLLQLIRRSLFMTIRFTLYVAPGVYHAPGITDIGLNLHPGSRSITHSYVHYAYQVKNKFIDTCVGFIQSCVEIGFHIHTYIFVYMYEHKLEIKL